MFRVKTLALFALIVLNAAAVVAQQSVKQYTIEQFMNTTRIGGSSF